MVPSITELYDWLHERDGVAFVPVNVVNDPALVARNRNMVSINGALSIDLLGQIAADRLGSLQYSGIGGHEDFLMAAVGSTQGRSLLCLPSTAMVAERPTSRIVGHFEPERAKALISIAHPDFRDELHAWAERMGLTGP